MHNWEHYGRLPAYFLMAALVASCGGGSDLSLNGQSSATIVDVPAKVLAAINGSTAVSIRLIDGTQPLANKLVTIQVSSGSATLSKSSVETDANGIANFSLLGNGDVDKGILTVTYTDSKNDITRQTIPYEVIDGATKASSYTLESNNTNDIVISTSGQTTASITMTLKDGSGKAVGADKLIEFGLASNIAGVGRLGATTARTNASGQVTVSIDGLNQLAGDNTLLVSYVDELGSKATKSIPFRIVNQLEVLLTAQTDLLKTGTDSVILTATVFNASQSLVKNAKVSFQVLSNEPMENATERCSQNVADANQFKPTQLVKTLRGTLNKNDILTDENGQATTVFSVADNSNSNRRIIVTVGSDTLGKNPTDCVDLFLRGTTVALDPTVINTSVGQENQITATVRNGRGAGVVGVPITFDGGGITRTDPTGATGTVTLDKLLFNADATITAKNTAYGLSGSTKVVVSGTGLKVSFVNAKGEDITKGGINTSGYFVKVQSKPANKTVKFVTTLGTIITPLLDNDLNGDGIAKAEIRSIFPGMARVDIVETDVGTGIQTITGHAEIPFVSTIPSKMTLQTSLSTLKPKEQAVIVTKVLDAKDNPVSDALVEFTREEDPSNGGLSTSVAKTDADGKASVTYTAGTLVTAKDAVKISAIIKADAAKSIPADIKPVGTVKNPDGSAQLTVGGQALFISIAAGKTLLVVDDTTYALPLSVAVTDAVGQPVRDSNISVQVIPTRFFKGIYFYNTLSKTWQTAAVDHTAVSVTGAASIDLSLLAPSAACLNEDTNENGILDLLPKSEDVNTDGMLSPGNPVSVIGKLVTNDAGRSAFTIQYGKSYANWLEVKVIASTEVSGSESKTDRTFILPVLSADVTDQAVTPPGGTISPYGRPSIVFEVAAGVVTSVLTSSDGTKPLYKNLALTDLDTATVINPCTQKQTDFNVYYRAP